MSRLAVGILGGAICVACSAPKPAAEESVAQKSKEDFVVPYFERVPRRPDVAAYPPVRENVFIPAPQGRTMVVVRIVNHERPKHIAPPVFTPAPEPQRVQPLPTERKVIDEVTVHFAFGSAVLGKEDTRKLDELVQRVGSSGATTVNVEAYTDSAGSEAQNLTLSRRRADAVKDYIVGRGIDGSRVTATGVGEANPVASNATPGGRAKNRRAEIELNSQGR